jgi:hypothetical protein
MGFWNGVLGGSDPTLNKNIPKFGAISEFSTGMGEKDLTQASDFYGSILSGDKTKQAKVLASPISTIQNETQQKLNSNAQFAPRSGGTAASNEMAKSRATGSISEMIASLMSGSAGALGSMGKGLLDTGVSTLKDQDAASAERLKNWSDSILGMGLSQGAGFAEGFGLGKIPGVPKTSTETGF